MWIWPVIVVEVVYGWDGGGGRCGDWSKRLFVIVVVRGWKIRGGRRGLVYYGQ